MKPAPFELHRPTRLDETLQLLGSLENARPLAGGQTLVPMMNFRFVQPTHLVDLNRVEELDGVHAEESSIRVGAMTRQRALMGNGALAERMPILGHALKHVGHRQTRARGTIGGSLAHFDPAAELCQVAALYDAKMTLVGRGGRRVLRFEEFGIGYLSTAIAADELLTEVAFESWPAGHGWGFEEFAQRPGDYALAMVSCLAAVDSECRIVRLAVAVSGLGPIPQRLGEVESELTGHPADEEAARAIAAKASGIDAMDDAYVTGAYRQHLAGVMAWRAAQAAFRRAMGQKG